MQKIVDEIKDMAKDDYVMLDFKDFITHEDAEYLIELATPHIVRSQIVKGQDEICEDEYRTSSDCKIPLEDPVIKKLCDKIVNITKIPIENFERPRFVSYEKGQYYREHHDCIPKDVYPVEYENGGHRWITALLYLSDGYEGGETNFTKINQKMKGEFGKMILFPNLNQDKTPHVLAFHEGCEVTEGRKYILNLWIREREHDSEMTYLNKSN
jgi:prolyl 4-hydroxylase